MMTYFRNPKCSFYVIRNATLSHCPVLVKLLARLSLQRVIVI